MKKILTFVLLATLMVWLLPLGTFAAVTPQDTGYTWGSVPVGAGGFVTGIVIHPTEPNLVYCRTDVGGCYRWDPINKTWIQLFDLFGTDKANYYGVDGLALDPNNPNVIYAAAGKYTGGTGGCDVLKSTDRGLTWQNTNLPGATFEGNGVVARGFGECLMVDPANSNVVLAGTATVGLWRSTNGGGSWTKVYTTASAMRTIAFDPTSVQGGATRTVYATIEGGGLLKSTDNGATWSSVSGAPATIKRMEVRNDGVLFAAATTGLYKYTGSWTNISPSSTSGTWNGINIDPTNAQIMVCVGPQNSANKMNIPIWRTTDGGANWVNIRQTSRGVNTLPWAQNTSAPGDELSSNTHDIKIDPNDPKRVWFCDWGGVQCTEDITASGEQVWNYLYQGIEEVVPRHIICPPTGPYRLIEGIADVDGFAYTDYKQFPQRQIRQVRDAPWLMSTAQLDYCQQSPNIVVRVGMDWNSNAKAELSVNNTESWQNITFAKKDNPTQTFATPVFGQVAVSAQLHPETGKPTVVVIPAKGIPLISYDLCQTWEAVAGVTDTTISTQFWDKGLHLVADQVNGAKFYLQDRKRTTSQVYVSTDWGKTWTKTTTLAGTPAENWNVDRTYIKAAPYTEGEVWSCTHGSKLSRSTDGGVSFTPLANVSDIECFGFGKNAPGRTNATLYVFAKVNNVKGVYRSIDNGVTFTRINHDTQAMGCSPKQLEGDMRTFGVVYIGTDGRGTFYGEPTGTDSTTGIQRYVTGFRDSATITDWALYQNGTGTPANGYGLTGRLFKNTWTTASGTRDCIYTGMTFGDRFTYSCTVRNGGNGTGNESILYFNYTGKDNYYAVVFPGGAGSLPRLIKREKGVTTVLATSQVPYSLYAVKTITITYVDGKITVQGDATAQLVPLMQVQDATFTSGKIGFGSTSTVTEFSYPNVVQNPAILSPSVTIEENPTPELPVYEEVHYTSDFPSGSTDGWNLSAGEKTMNYASTNWVGISGSWDGLYMGLLQKPMSSNTGYCFSADWSQAYGGAVANTTRFVFNQKNSNYYYVEFEGGAATSSSKVKLCKLANGTTTKLHEYASPLSTQTNGGSQVHHITISCAYDGAITVVLDHFNGTRYTLFDGVYDETGTQDVWQGGNVGVATMRNSTLFNNIRVEQCPLLALDCRITNRDGDQITVAADLLRGEWPLQKGMMLVCVKEADGTLASVARVPFSLDAAGKATPQITVSGGSGQTIDCYFWDDGGILKPLASMWRLAI